LLGGRRAEARSRSGELAKEGREAVIRLHAIPKQEQAELIDKLIVSSPRIDPLKDKSDHPVEDKSKPFTEEKGVFITETLAKIYINQ
jgi:hypothetical protein